MRNGENIRKRVDGRFEARYVKGRDDNGRIIYGSCYGKTLEEAKEKRNLQIAKSSKKKSLSLLILGAGSHGKEVYEIARQLKIFRKIAFLDDNIRTDDGVLGCWSSAGEYADEFSVAIVAVGDKELRKEWTKKLIEFGFLIPTLIHPTAFISEDVDIGEGAVICARATVSVGVKIGKGCIIESGSTLPRKFVVPDWGDYVIDKLI